MSYQESGEISINFQNSTFTITEIDDGNAEGVMAGTYVFSFPNVTLTFTNEDGYTESLPGILSGDNLLLMEYVFVRR